MAERRKLPNRGKKIPKWQHPITVELEYNKILQRYVAAMNEVIETVLIPAIPSLLEQRNLEIPEAARSDAWPENAERLMGSVRQGFDTIPVNMPANITEIANKTNVWNDKQWRKILESTFGVDIFQREPWLNETLNSWSKENAALITKMTDDHISQVEGIVQRGVRGGVSAKRLTGEVMERTGVTRNRAKLIARDQVSKLNGQLTELRQTNIGVRKYIWRDSDDKRVRSTHRANDGKTFSWNKAPMATGHPGEDYQCRCWAEPIFDEIMDEMGMKEAEPEPAPTRPGAVTKSYKTKASAQSARSRAGLTGKAGISHNSTTGKWELKIPTGVKPKPPVPKPTPRAQTFTVKPYGSKASAQSAKSRGKFKTAEIAFNSKTGKWELKIPTGVKPPAPTPKPTPTPTVERPAFRDERGNIRPSNDIRRDVLKTGRLPQELEDTVRKYEDKIRKNPFESGATIKVNGRAMANRATQHRKSSVMIRGDHTNRIVTHNHPSGTTFSPADIENSYNRRRLQMRATTERRLYTLTRKKQKWISDTELKKWYAGRIGVFNKEYDRAIDKAFTRGRARAYVETKRRGWSIGSDGYDSLINEYSIDEAMKVTRAYAKRHDWHYIVEEL